MASVGEWFVPFRGNDPSMERNWTSLEEFLRNLSEIGGVKILGRRDCATDPLPPDIPEGSNGTGDAYICDPENHLWVWDGDQWVDTGPWGTAEHDLLIDVTSDQHHAKAHTHAGDGSGSVAHIQTTGQTPDDHHSQQHLLYGSDHPDVDSAGALAIRDLLAQPEGSSLWTPETRLNWRRGWLPTGTYYIDDLVTDGVYTAVANKTTTDRPAPQPIGERVYLLPDAPAWVTSQYTGSVYTGMHFTPAAGQLFQVLAVRTWIPNVSPDAHYQVVTIDNVTGVLTPKRTFNGDVLAAPGWYSALIDPFFITDADDFSIVLHSSNSAGTTDYNHPWVRSGDTNQDNDPLAGNWTQNNISTRIRMSTTDDDAVDRSAELAAVVPGTTIQIQDEADLNAYSQFEVVAVTNNGTWFLYDVILLDTGASGSATIGLRQQAYFEVPIAAPTDYVTFVDGVLPYPNIDGYLSFDELTGGVDTDDGYGIDIQLQEFTTSLDWDFIAISGGSGSGGGGTPFSGLHDDLTDVTPDQHHPQLHDLDSHTDVSAPTPIDGYRLAWDADQSLWIPKLSTSALGIVSFDYRILNATPTPSAGRLAGNVDDPPTVTTMYVNKIDDNGEDISLFLENVVEGTWMNIYDDNDADNHRSFDVTGSSVLVGDVWEIPVAFFDQAGTPLVTNQQVNLFIRYVSTETFDGAHSSLTNVLTDQHHTRYTDAEAVTAVGPHTPAQTYLHADLTDITSDDHHAKYTDAEAVNAVGPHTPPFTPSNLHADLTDVSSDQHHAKVHTTEGADHNSGAAIDGQILTADGAGGQTWETPVAGVTDHALLSNVTADQHHVRYSDAEAVSAVGPHTPAQTFLHADLTDVTANQHHTKYTDAEAVTAVGPHSPDPTGVYLPLAGGTMSGDINMDGNDVLNLKIAGYDIFGGSSIQFSATGALLLNTGELAHIALRNSPNRVEVNSDIILGPGYPDDPFRVNFQRTVGGSQVNGRLDISGGLNDSGPGLSVAVDVDAVPTQVAVFGKDKAVFQLPIRVFGTANTIEVHRDTIGKVQLGVAQPSYTGASAYIQQQTEAGAGGGILYVGATDADLTVPLRLPSIKSLNARFDIFADQFEVKNAAGVRNFIVYDGLAYFDTSITNLRFQGVGGFPTGGTANLSINASSGQIFLITSSRRYKSNIDYDTDWMADLDLQPVTFRHDGDGEDYFGFIAEDIDALDPRASIFNADGDVDNYDVRAVVAVLAAKVNRLEQAQ